MFIIFVLRNRKVCDDAVYCLVKLLHETGFLGPLLNVCGVILKVDVREIGSTRIKPLSTTLHHGTI